MSNYKLQITNEDREDLLLTEFAERNKGKHGGDGDMFAALAQEYRRERKGRRTLWVSLTAAAAAVIITLAATLPFILRGKSPGPSPGPQPPSPPQYLIVDGLTVISITEAQLYKELGHDTVIPRPKGYALEEISLYVDCNEVIKAYQYYYSSAVESETKDINVYCVINNDFVFGMEENIDETGVNTFLPPSFFIRIVISDINMSLSRFVKNDKFIISLDKHDPVLLAALLKELTV